MDSNKANLERPRNNAEDDEQKRWAKKPLTEWNDQMDVKNVQL